MSVVTLASIKGSPGVTTAALALAAAWPAGRKVLLVEADPFGGDLAARHGSTITGGLPSLFAAARRSLAPDAVWDHVDHLPGGLPVLFGLSGVQGAIANEKAWPVVAAALGGLDADVVVDAGRLLPNFAGGAGANCSSRATSSSSCAIRRSRDRPPPSRPAVPRGRNPRPPTPDRPHSVWDLWRF